MELKKNPKLELSNYRLLIFAISLSMSIGMVLIAFEWKTVGLSSTVSLETSGTAFEEVMEVPITNQVTPPPPKVSTPTIIEIPDEEEIQEIVDINLDIEISEPVVESLVFEDTPEEEVADEVFNVVEIMPTFPGGSAKFIEFISQNLKYPKKALRANVEGKVIVSFIVEADGNLSEIEVVKGIGYDCDEEAVRVLSSTPDWIPGQQMGRNVKVRVMLPLNFNI